jgi:hypothetical protein
MNQTTIHNPDRFMVDLRQILTQGRKRIGLLIGAGAPVALKVNLKTFVTNLAGCVVAEAART